MFIIYVIDLSTKNKMLKTGFHIFTKIKNTDRLKLKKNTCFSYFISENPVFFFFRKCSIFHGSIPLTGHYILDKKVQQTF